MSIKETIIQLEKTLKGKIRRTKKINDTIGKTIQNIASLYDQTRKLNPFLENTPSFEVKQILESSYKSLRNLQEIEKFTSILLFIDSLLQDYLRILDSYIQVTSELKKIQELKEKKRNSENNLSKFVNTFKKDVETLSLDNSIETDEKDPIFKLSSSFKPFNSNQSKYIIIDKFECFSQKTKNNLLKENWNMIGNNAFLSISSDEKLLENAKEIIPKNDFFECYESIGELYYNKTFDHVPDEFYKKLLMNQDVTDLKILSGALHGDTDSLFLLGELLYSQKFYREAKHWLKEANTPKSLKMFKKIEKIENPIKKESMLYTKSLGGGNYVAASFVAFVKLMACNQRECGIAVHSKSNLKFFEEHMKDLYNGFMENNKCEYEGKIIYLITEKIQPTMKGPLLCLYTTYEFKEKLKEIYSPEILIYVPWTDEELRKAISEPDSICIYDANPEKTHNFKL